MAGRLLIFLMIAAWVWIIAKESKDTK
jgi:hypothetical protein